MKLPKKSVNSRRGLSLIEIILAMALIAIIFAIGLPVSLNFYRSYSFQAEVNTVISLLEQARSLAMTNHNESAWGLYIDSDRFTVFRGLDYAGRYAPADRFFDRAGGIAIAGNNEMIFNQLSGRTNAANIIISGSGRTANININSEGAINY